MTSAPFLTMEEPYDRALTEVTRQLSDQGLRVFLTFDLPAARHADVECACPHHGTDQCDCHLGVLLVYGKGSEPASLLAHGYDYRTWFSMVDTPQQPVDPVLCAEINRILLPGITLPAMDGRHWLNKAQNEGEE